MAKLISEEWTLFINYTHYDYYEIEYQIGFLWNGEKIFKDGILKGSHFYSIEYEDGSLLRTIKRVLETNEPDYWEPIEPYVTLAIYPNMSFPFLRSNLKVIMISDRYKKELEDQERERELRRVEPDRLPDDEITIILKANSVHFKDSEAHSDNGIALHLVVTRETLEKFAEDLEAEHNEIVKRYETNV